MIQEISDKDLVDLYSDNVAMKLMGKLFAKESKFLTP